ncbi:MAG: 2-C-methyl-D-erythritol 4-phosphate cytidylyltransferase [Clostridia bacterium]|nr:2-C-methyl-D-erythritol 4-phosphate cytidylyltransferase [Clostridia bacterium]
MICAAIVAGGNGSRMGADLPKQFLEISGKPVIIHTVLCFLGKVDKICIACHGDYVDYMKKSLEKHGILDADVIPGGADRMESVSRIAEHFLSGGAWEQDIILTHDGVRPFVSDKMINDSIENARTGHFCTVAINSTDTVCISADGENIDCVPERRGVFNIQTPQTFTLGKLAEMLGKCETPGGYTDLCGLALAMGEKVKIVEGSPENIKITVPADLAVAEKILERKYENR